MTEEDLGNCVYKKVVVDGKIFRKWVRLSQIEEYDADENIIRVLDGSVFLEKGHEVLKSLIKYKETLNDYDEAGNCIHKSVKTVFIDEPRFLQDDLGDEYLELNNGKYISRTSLISDEEEFYTLDEKGNTVQREFSVGSKRVVGTSTEYEYDQAGNPIFKHETSFGGVNADTFYEYDDKGKCLYQKFDNHTYQKETFYEFDENGKCFHSTQIIKYTYDSYNRELFYEYNDKGHLCHTKRCQFESNGIVAESHTWYDYEYDENSKIKRRFTFVENKF